MNNLSDADKYLKLREEFPFFSYESYSYSVSEKGFLAEFHFNLSDKYDFRPALSFPYKTFYQWKNLDKNLLDNLIFHIGMIELISYWKAACPENLIIKPHQLDADQISFWKKIYFHGLGEFFYLNSIEVSIDDFMCIQANEGSLLAKTDIMTSNSVIIPVGGGKDSVVSLELLKNIDAENLPLIMNPRGASLETAELGGYPRENIIEINRSIHPQLIELNKLGFLNGHTPFSALLAFVCLLSAAFTGKRNIALSNESSANESTVENSTVNHQYSKSYEFEADFRNYTAKYISSSFNYFSFLRPLSELQIASLFARNNKYFSSFKSCNAGSKTDVWGVNCPKCLFAFIILSRFIERKTMISIFAEDLLNNADMKFYFEQLCGIEAVKPFECVGTVDEVNLAVNMLIRKLSDDDLPLLLRYYKTTAKFNYYSHQDLNSNLHHFNNEHFLEPEFENILKFNI